MQINCNVQHNEHATSCEAQSDNQGKLFLIINILNVMLIIVKIKYILYDSMCVIYF